MRAFYTGWYKELVTATPTIRDGYVYPMEGAGLGLDLRPAVFERGRSRRPPERSLMSPQTVRPDRQDGARHWLFGGLGRTMARGLAEAGATRGSQRSR